MQLTFLQDAFYPLLPAENEAHEESRVLFLVIVSTELPGSLIAGLLEGAWQGCRVGHSRTGQAVVCFPSDLLFLFLKQRVG